MDTLKGNPHADDGMRYAAEASEHNAWNYEDRLIMATMANAFATLALAHEQRTANLIAFYGYGDIVDLETITERLGL
ncbi:hypothetical protein [Paenarthrobacter sp. JL.01a]|uniref:hypothetical protein n=1 Tax=Paenarthrobacter sp. JL.01a TaxID=2979324 RepID=UPI0021CA5DF0|nr:hypothetical protein [Paenarthrobacter sp. JL.01a]UXM92529.1 hypothetical protein N5P29_04165 [Paenarthrobacter sp. JL.01a]